MAVRISRREVFDNLTRFKDSLSAIRAEERNKERSYPVLLNKKTGDLQFGQKIESFEAHFPERILKKEEWKEIQIDVQDQQGKVHFEMCDADHQKIEPEGLEPIAFRVLSETLEALNRLAEEHRAQAAEALPERDVLLDLSKVQYSATAPGLADLPGWVGSISRLKAEKMLRHLPHGTYLLRDGGEDSRAIAFHLSEENRTSVKAYLCTVVEANQKISDILFLETDQGWTVYQDDPDLSSSFYAYSPTAQGVLVQVRNRARQPLGQ